MKRRNFFLTIPGVLAAGKAIPKEQKEKPELKFAEMGKPYPTMLSTAATFIVIKNRGR